MAKRLRICRFCANKYEYCPSCGEYEHMEPWHLAYCSKNCKDIDEILSSWGAKLIDSETAANALMGKDLSREEFWNDNFKAAFEKVMNDVAASGWDARGKAEKPAKAEPKRESRQSQPAKGTDKKQVAATKSKLVEKPKTQD